MQLLQCFYTKTGDASFYRLTVYLPNGTFRLTKNVMTFTKSSLIHYRIITITSFEFVILLSRSSALEITGNVKTFRYPKNYEIYWCLLNVVFCKVMLFVLEILSYLRKKKTLRQNEKKKNDPYILY